MKLVICGSFGFGNAGDEAIPLAIGDLGHHLGMELDISIVGRFSNAMLPNVIGMGSDDEDKRESLRGLPVVMSGGGIIENKPRATIFRCRHLLSKLYSPRACLLGISVEPGVHFGFKNTWSLKRILKRFETVYTRDLLSERVLNELLPKQKTRTIGDLVLWLEPDQSQLPENLVLPKQFIAVVLAPRWKNDECWRAWIVSELAALHRELDLPIVFVPMSTSEYDDDRSEHKIVALELAKQAPHLETLVIESSLTPKAIVYLISCASILVSMRLHGCVMAYAQKTPFVGLTYHPKLFGFGQTVQLTQMLLPKSPPKQQNSEAYGYAFSDIGMPKNELVTVATQALSMTNFSMLTELRQRSKLALQEFLLSI